MGSRSVGSGSGGIRVGWDPDRVGSGSGGIRVSLASRGLPPGFPRGVVSQERGRLRGRLANALFGSFRAGQRGQEKPRTIQ
eukprot:481370-Prorocentrum_minimum.AAC.1